MNPSVFFHDDGAVDLLDQVERDNDRRAFLVRVFRLLFVIGQVPGLVALRPAGDEPRPPVKADAAKSTRNFKSKSGTRIIGLLVPFVSEVRDRMCRDVSRTSETGH